MHGSAGIILVNELIPTEFQFDTMRPVDSSLFKKKMTLFAKKYPKKFATNISKIAVLGEHMAYSLGANVGTRDLRGDVAKSKKLISSIDKKLSKAKTDDEKRSILLKGLSDATEIAKKISPENNEMAQQVRSGSRGKPVQFARMVVGPIYAVGMDQKPKTNLIKNNFTNGLSSHEYFNASSQGRFASVQAANATSEPGALGKVIIANTDSEKISELDCHTTNGIFKSVTDRHIIGHYTAGTKGVLIDKALISRLKGKTLKVRTPITCASKKGVCIKCYGLKANGRLPTMGENVGINSGQNVGEILTQMTISTKHSTMGKKDSIELSGVDGFKSIVNSPSSLRNSSAMVDRDGTVEKIEKALQGGSNIFVGKKKYHVEKGLKVSVKIGDVVEKGDMLSTGIVTPKQLMSNRGLNEAREYESDTLHKIFKDSTGQDLMKKHFDIIARGHLSLSKDKYGDISTHSSHSASYPKNSSISTVGRNIKGKYIAEDIGSISKGTKINTRVLELLNKWGVGKIPVTTEKPSFTPVFKSMEQKPTFTGSIFQKMNYRNITKALKEEITSSKTPSYMSRHNSDRGDHTSGFLRTGDR